MKDVDLQCYANTEKDDKHLRTADPLLLILGNIMIVTVVFIL